MQRRLGLFATVALLVTGACGPSFQAIYEGNSRFEHCYALEESPQAPMNAKADCWHDWSERYTFGQTRDRIHYAIARYVALSNANVVPTDEAIMMGAPGSVPRGSTITAPAPTNAFAPPPKVLEDYDGGTHTPLRPGERPVILGGKSAPTAAASAAPPPAAPLPRRTCASGCETQFGRCAERVDGGVCIASDGGTATLPGCSACDKAYATCMRGCFK